MLSSYSCGSTSRSPVFRVYADHIRGTYGLYRGGKRSTPCSINGILTGTLAGAVPPLARPPVYGMVYSLDSTTVERADTTEEHGVELEKYDEIIRNLVQI